MQRQMMSRWDWITWGENKNIRTCGTLIYRSRISKLRQLWPGAHVLLLYLGAAPKVRFGEKLHMHMVEILVSHSRWVVTLFSTWRTLVTSLACRWHTRLWVNLSYTRKTRQCRPRTWSYDRTSSVCLGGVSGDGWTNKTPIQVSRGPRKGKGLHLNHFPFVLLSPFFVWLTHSSRLEN